jgi:O-antigen ligase
MVTLDVSTVKLTAVMLSLIMLPLLVIHVELGGLAFLALLWTRVSDVAVATHGAPSIAAPFGLLLILASLTRRIAAGERIGLADLSPFVPVAPYLAVVLGSVLWSEWPDRALDSGIATLKDILVFWILVETLRGPAALRRAIFTLVLAGGVLAGLNLHQYLTGNFLSDYGGFAQSEVLNIVGQLDANRLGGPLNSPNFFALILVVLVPLGLATLRIRQPFVSRIAVVLALVTIVLTVLLTFSRGAALVLMLLLGLSAIRHRIGVSHLTLLGAGLVVVAALAPPTVWERIGTLAEPVASGSRETGAIVDTSVELRLGAQQTALEIFLEHPFVGAGSANFPPLYREVSRQIGVKAVGTEYFPHNLYLEILAELGVVGLAAFAAMVYALWAGLRRSRASVAAAGGTAHAVRELSFGIEAALVGYLAGMMLLQSSYPRSFWMLLALVVVATRASRDVATERHADGTKEQA